MPDTGALTFKPVDRSNWADFQALFDAPGGPKSCWCMVWRATAEEGRDKRGPARRNYLHQRIEHGVPIGLLAYDSGKPMGWVSIAPARYLSPAWRSRRSARRGHLVACLHGTCRAASAAGGLANLLIAAGVEHARRAGATVLEAYPVDDDAPSYRFMGFVPAFERFGFVHVGTAGTRRHVMRFSL